MVQLELAVMLMCCKGFTLAELLIVLAILAVIATFTIPKLLTSQADQQKKAIFKETISAIQALAYKDMLDKTIAPDGSNNCNYGALLNDLGALKICMTNSDTEGCWSAGANATGAGGGSEHGEPGAVLANGAAIIGLNTSYPCSRVAFLIDWNGLTPPNVEGDDQLYVGFGITGNYPTRMTPEIGSKTFFASIFQ